MFGGRVCQQTVGIPIDTTCAPLLSDLFLYSYETDVIGSLCRKAIRSLPDSYISRSAI